MSRPCPRCGGPNTSMLAVCNPCQIVEATEKANRPPPIYIPPPVSNNSGYSSGVDFSGDAILAILLMAGMLWILWKILSWIWPICCGWLF